MFASAPPSDDLRREDLAGVAGSSAGCWSSVSAMFWGGFPLFAAASSSMETIGDTVGDIELLVPDAGANKGRTVRSVPSFRAEPGSCIGILGAGVDCVRLEVMRRVTGGALDTRTAGGRALSMGFTLVACLLDIMLMCELQRDNQEGKSQYRTEKNKKI